MSTKELLMGSIYGDEKYILNLIIKFSPYIKKRARIINYEEAETDLVISLIEGIPKLKNQEKRDLKQEERENNYQKVIASLTDKLNSIEEIKFEVLNIKEELKKNNF